MSENQCPSCGAQLPAHALGGHCPRCLLQQGLDSDAPGPDRGSNGQTLDLTARPGSVLETIGSTVGHVPHVLLCDTGPAEEPSPVVRPAGGDDTETSIRYQIEGEIARGGMGAILKGHDPDLGRDVALKVLREDLRDNAEMVRRFVEEAQIGGQLQHPGIIPIYELGTFTDRRPFFSMKLVKGRTLAALLKERTDPAHGLPRFLGIFEQVGQTMAYAHARGVIHRDLKPSNIMVGSFGEVQVMDWGLAKVLPQGDTAGEPEPAEAVVSAIRTVRSGSDADASRAGTVLGTPAYMAPEQAGGDVEAIDERADVFGLGSILCEILTGRPAYTGPSSDAILRRALRGDTADALWRLDGCGADAELVDLARHCLAAEVEQRPRDAGEVARRLTAYLTGVQERLKAAELARAAEEARAEEAQATAAAAERARAAEEARAEQAQAATVAAVGRARAERRVRRMTVGLAASVVITGALGTAGWRWMERDRMGRTAAAVARVNTALREATRLRGQAQGAAVGNLVRWTEALAAVQKARELLEPGSDPSLQRQVWALLADITVEKQVAEADARAAESDRRFLNKLVDIRSAKADDPNGSTSEADYAKAFREAGIDVSTLSPGEAGARIKARPAAVAIALAAALDDWASVRRDRRHDTTGASRLTAAARDADPDLWRNQLRAVLETTRNPQRTSILQHLARSAPLGELPAVTLDLLGQVLLRAGDRKGAEAVLRQGQRRYPGDVWLNYDLAQCLETLARREEAIRYYTAARSIRPGTAHQLGHALEAKGESEEAIAVFEDLARLCPGDKGHLVCLGQALQARGRTREAGPALEAAIAALREEIHQRPDDVDAHVNLGLALSHQGEAGGSGRRISRGHPAQAR